MSCNHILGIFFLSSNLLLSNQSMLLCLICQLQQLLSDELDKDCSILLELAESDPFFDKKKVSKYEIFCFFDF